MIAKGARVLINTIATAKCLFSEIFDCGLTVEFLIVLAMVFIVLKIAIPIVN